MHKNQKGERGIASIIIVLLLVIVLSLVSIGFSRLVNRDVSQSVEDQKARIASYAAESGINQIADYIKQNASFVSGSIDTCKSDLLDNHLNANKGLSGDTNTQYTCALLDYTPGRLTYSAVKPMQSQVIRLDTTTTPNSLFFEWTASNPHYDNFVPGQSSHLLDENSWNISHYAPMVRLTFYAIPSGDLTGNGYVAKTVFLYPRLNSGGNIVSIGGSQPTDDGSLFSVNCANKTFNGFIYNADNASCGVILNNLPNSGQKYYLRIMPVYGAADVTIQAQGAPTVSLGNPGSHQQSAKIVQADSSGQWVCPGYNTYLWICTPFDHKHLCVVGPRPHTSQAPDRIVDCYFVPGSSSSSGGGSSSGGSSGGGDSSSGGGSGGGGGGVQFINTQAIIDVTAKSNDVVKRLQATVTLASNTPNQAESSGITEFALQSAGTLCKRYVIDASGNVSVSTVNQKDCTPQPTCSNCHDNLPVAVTHPATNQTAGSVDLNGTVQPNADSATYFFQYAPGANPKPGENPTDVPPSPGNPVPIDKNKGDSYNYPVTYHLQMKFNPGDLYHFRVCALNSASKGQPSCGQWLQFGYNSGVNSKVVTGYFESQMCSTDLKGVQHGVCQVRLVVYGQIGSKTYVCTQTEYEDMPTSGSLKLTADASNCPDDQINNVGQVEVDYSEACDPYKNKFHCWYHHSEVAVTYAYNKQKEKQVAYFANNGACVPGSGDNGGSIVCGQPAFYGGPIGGLVLGYYNLNGNGNLIFKTTNP